MGLSLHDTASAYEAEFCEVRAALMARGSSIKEWAERAGVSRQYVSNALKGKSFGPKAREIRRRLLSEARHK
jgi:lambda repressor-like predicted transcriptional regulator